MPRFDYEARKAGGAKLSGQIEAEDSKSAAANLLKRGLTPVKIKVAKASSSVLDIDLNQWLLGRVSSEELIFFCRQMYALYKAGVPIVSSVTRVAETTRSKALAHVLNKIVEKLLAGQKLTMAMAQFPRVFSSLFVSVIDTGEQSGNLDAAFMQLAEHIDLEVRTKARIKQATRYPIMVVGALLAAILVINFFVIPTFANLFKNYNLELPWATRVLMASSEFMLNYAKWFGLGLLAFIIGFIYFVRTPYGKRAWHWFLLKLPVLGSIFTRICLARFARTFAMMSRAGVPLTQAISLVSRTVGNEYMGDKMAKMRTNIERGESLFMAATSSRLFSPLVLQMLAVGEESGTIDDMLVQTAEFYEREVDYDISRLGDLIQPFLVVGLGIVVLILALGVMLPMWDLVKIAKR